MNLSRQIAAFLGPTLMLIAVSEAKNLRIWAAGDPPLTYLAGLIWFLGGLAIVRVHNRWSTGWPVVITLAGWFLLLGGLFRLLLPEAQQGNRNTPELWIYATDLVLFATGVLLTIRAHRSGSARNDDPVIAASERRDPQAQRVAADSPVLSGVDRREHRALRRSRAQ